MRVFLRQTGVAARVLIVMTLILGVGYPAAVFLAGRVVADRSDGSWVADADGAVVGSALIGQSFDGPDWFHPRPSAAGDGYDALSSSGSNLGPNSTDLLESVAAARNQIATRDSVPVQQVPADAVTASGSGLDPHISPQYAALQVARVARRRGLKPAQVTALVTEHTQGRWLAFLGEPRVNVLELNLAIAALG